MRFVAPFDNQTGIKYFSLISSKKTWNGFIQNKHFKSL
jgi:hypothetical protein